MNPAFIFNNCISTGTVPCKLKMAKVPPVFKGGNNLDVNNNRPISALPVFSNIFEKAIFNRLCKKIIKMSFIIVNLVFFQVDLLLIH